MSKYIVCPLAGMWGQDNPYEISWFSNNIAMWGHEPIISMFKIANRKKNRKLT